MSDKSTPVMIVGAGAFGLATAFQFVNAGYEAITVFEQAETIPSPHSAAFDLNKIVRAEYEDQFYTDLALEAIAGWKRAPFAPHYHQTGYIVATSGAAPRKARDTLDKSLASVSSHPAFAASIRPLRSGEEFRRHAWQLSGPLTGFTGYVNTLAGYAHSSDALRAVHLWCVARGVRFLMGPARGKVAGLLYSGEGERRRCVVGVRTADGREHRGAAVTVCALGAYGAALVPGLASFTVARCWSVAHVQLDRDEAALLRGIPATNVRDLGFFFEPDPETRLFKLCPLGAGYVNTTGQPSGLSLPPPPPSAAAAAAEGEPEPEPVVPSSSSSSAASSPPADYIPADDERKLRQLLRETLPWMAERPFVGKKLCWFSDTRDSNLCIDFAPGLEGSLVVVSGDSGQGFKMMPVLGKWVLDLVRRGKQDQPRWQWRRHQATAGNAADWGGDVSWRIGRTRELAELVAEEEEEKKKIGLRAKL